MKNDSLLEDLRIIREEMRGINPKVSTYQILKEREMELVKRLGGNNRTDFDEIAILERPRTSRCETPGCKNVGRPKTKPRPDGAVRRYKFCDKHRSANREYRRQWTPEEKAAYLAYKGSFKLPTDT